MKSFVWFVLGAASGFVIAHLVNKDPRGHELLAQVDARIGEFTDRVTDAYHEQEARLSDLVDSASESFAAAKSAASDTVAAAKDAATDVVNAAKDAVSDASSKTTD